MCDTDRAFFTLNLEADKMSSDKPSRRQWLCAFLAGLFGWLWPGKSKAAAKKPQPKQKFTFLNDKQETVISYTYDALGRCIRIQESPEPIEQ